VLRWRAKKSARARLRETEMVCGLRPATRRAIAVVGSVVPDQPLSSRDWSYPHKQFSIPEILLLLFRRADTRDLAAMSWRTRSSPAFSLYFCSAIIQYS
jgi:hypothetical protein